MTEENIDRVEPQDEEWGTPLEKLELGILVLDGSGSMQRLEPGSEVSKAEMVERHLVGTGESGEQSLVGRLQNSTRAHEVQLAALTFDHRVKRAVEVTPVAELQRESMQLNLLEEHGGATAIGLALAEAGQIAEEFLAAEEEDIPRYAIILLMTDGREEGPQKGDPEADPVTVAEAIKAKGKARSGSRRPDVVIAAAAYGDDADEETLQKVVTPALEEDASFFRRVHSGAELRDFFMQSIAMVDNVRD